MHKRKDSISFYLSAFMVLLFVLSGGFCVYLYRLNHLADITLSDDMKQSQSTVFTRPLVLENGVSLSPEDLLLELDLLGYRQKDAPDTPGSYVHTGHDFLIYKRDFLHPGGFSPRQQIRIKFDHDRIVRISDPASRKKIENIMLDPVEMGNLFPDTPERKKYITLENTPSLLIDTLIAMEDKRFYAHHGIDVSALFRAASANVKQGRVVQGGSTLTQQLARCLFFGNEKSLKRKINESVMSCLLEIKYSKEEILEFYVNRVYLGQKGNLTISGFSHAGEYYFGRDIHDLAIHEIAFLVGLLKGPSWYNPFKFPERAKQRRNLVLETMARERVISFDQAGNALNQDMVLNQAPAPPRVRFPGVMDLVRREVLIHFSGDDNSGINNIKHGLRVFTTCDPIVQLTVENAVSRGLEQLETDRNLTPGSLETGVVVTTANGCDVLALAGSRNTGFDGFNHALDARRPVGSLIKPVYFLAALEHPDRYNLITRLNDSVLHVRDDAGKTWSPKNLNNHYYGDVPLYEALTHSLNTASVRLGLELGLDTLRSSLKRLGFKREFSLYPSSLIGAISMSPIEVAAIYHTFSSRGFTAPARVIQSICDKEGVVITPYRPTRVPSFRPDAVYLLNTALQKVFTEGTAEKYHARFPDMPRSAGKTGTSDDLRDSWFCGFTGDRLGVVWIGKDDYTPLGLTGAEGALKVWMDIMSRISHHPFSPAQPETITWKKVDPRTGLKITDENCGAGVSLPFITGHEPVDTILCQDVLNKEDIRISSTHWLKNIFNKTGGR